MPTRERCEELRAEAFADDVDVIEDIFGWTEDEVTEFFESGGTERPAAAGNVSRKRIIQIRAQFHQHGLAIKEHMYAWSEDACIAYFESAGAVEPSPTAAAEVDLRALSMCQQLAPEMGRAGSTDCELESARSTIDGVVPGGRSELGRQEHEDEVLAEQAAAAGGSGDPLGDSVGAEFLDDDLEAGGDERTEDAMLDEERTGNPMASVPVTTRSGHSGGGGGCPAPAAAKEGGDGVDGWGVKKLKEFLLGRGVSISGLSEKSEFVAEVRKQLALEAPAAAGLARPSMEELAAAAAAAGGGGGGGGGGGEQSAKLKRMIRKVEDIKATGDGAFRDQNYEKAERHYTSALARAAESEEPLPDTLMGALYSNRSGNRMLLQRHEQALADGRMALRHRKGWARAFSRVGAALFALRRYDEAKAVYEEGISTDPAAAELRTGLGATLAKMGSTAGGSETCSAAKLRGNTAFKEGDLDGALAAYSEAIAIAPADETLYSNRAATYAKLERYKESLEDAKRAISLQGKWGKAYSRAGFAALKLEDTEAAYWFYSNGLRWEPSHAELRNGRGATLHALQQMSTARNARRLERFKRDAARAPARVFGVSDVHYDHPGAKEWAASLSRTAYANDTLVVAGDVADTFVAIKLALRAFRAVFRRVFYVPGNHDMWIRPKGQHSDEPSMFADSVQKLLSLWQMCDEIDVDVGPAKVSTAVTIVPLDSWYTCLFDHHDPRPGSALFDKWCNWPIGYDDVWQFMTGLNEARLQIVEKHAAEHGGAGDVITFSHFLPRKELPIPGIHEMAKACGCPMVETQLRRIGSKCHIFGHTHINTVDTLQGVTYMQNAMGYGIAPGTKLTVIHDSGRFKTYLA